MSFGPSSYQKAVELISRFPSMGKKSAQRLALHLLRQKKEEILDLGQALVEMKERIRNCEVCFAYTESQICEICTSSNRNHGLVCVVEDPTDLFAIEQSNQFQGVYHVLHGRLSPLDGIGPEELKVAELVKRVESTGQIEEMILAMNPDVEGDATALYLAKIMEARGIKVSRIAMGVPLGGSLEYTDQITLGRAILERREFSS